MANGKKKDETTISPYFIAIAAGLLIILMAVLLAMSGVLDRGAAGEAPTEVPVEETAAESSAEIPERAAPDPTPTETPT